MSEEPMAKHILLRLALLPLLAVGGCSMMDPYTRQGTWRPAGVNDANLGVMLADPMDLVRGHGQAGTDGQVAATAINRLRTGQVKPLLIEDTLSSATAGGSGPSSGGSAPASGGPAGSSGGNVGGN
jgi:hypothetical protein